MPKSRYACDILCDVPVQGELFADVHDIRRPFEYQKERVLNILEQVVSTTRFRAPNSP